MTIQELINRLRNAFSPNAITPEALGYILQAIYNLIIAKDNLVGDKVPTSTDGVNGNFYFDTSAKILYIKANGAWIPIIRGTPIVIAQEEGNSLDIVMSQNAVSTLLETIRQSIIDKVSTESLNEILANYYLKTSTYSKEEVNGLINAINGFTPKIVLSVSEVVSTKYIYFISTSGVEERDNKYDEYLFINGKAEKIGTFSANVDLSQYVTIGILNMALSDIENTYSKKVDTYTKAEVDSLISTGVGLKFKTVSDISEVKEDGYLYFILKSQSSNGNVYDEYMYINNKAELIGNFTTGVDLSNYVTLSQLDDYVTSMAFTTAISNLDDTYVAKEVGKELIPTTALNKLNQLPTSGNSLPFEVITDISEVTEKGVLYLLPYDRPNSKYDEYLFVNGVPELMGSFDIDVDLSNYTTSSQLTAALSAYVTSSAFNTAISNLANTYVAKETGKELIPATALLKLNDLPNANEIFLKSSLVEDFGYDSTKVMSQKAVTKNISEILQLEGEELYAYGVKWTEVQTSPSLERIGNINMHKTLPCHKVRGCLVKNDGSINYYLYPSSDLLKADGVTPSVLDGTDGDVMNYRKFYYRTAIKDGVHVNWMSPYPLQGYTLYEGFTGRYKGSINRTTGKIHSVINTTPEFRGGGNTAAWDSDGRSLLGCAVSGINRATFRSGARINRSTDWNGARGHDDFFALLIYFRVKWATHNTQLAYNAALDASGYYQGGMGSGTTNLSGAKWGGYNGYNPFIPCGYTAEFGDGSGVKDFVMPFEYDTYDTVAAAQKYTGVYSDARGYATGEYCSDGVDSYKGSGTATLYRCKADAAAGVALSNTTHFETVTRTITQAIRMDGEEQWFGEIWEFYSDVLIEMDATAQTSKCYIFRNQSQIAETRTGNEEFLCNLPITDGWIKLFNENSIFPKSTGGGSTTFGCDYTYIGFPASGVSLRGCLGGGLAYNDASAGASCSASYGSPSLSHAYFGGRLVLKKRKLENQ